MNFNRLLISVLSTTILYHSLSYPLSGKVINEKNSPVEGVTVTALRAGQHVITKSDGSFEFSTTSVNHPENNYQKIPFSFKNRHVRISLSTSVAVSIAQYSLDGRLITTIYHQKLDAGIHEINCNPLPNSQNLSILLITIGRMSYVVKICDIGGAKIVETRSRNNSSGYTVNRGAMTSNTTFPDTLILTKNGYIIKRVPVKKPTDDLGNLRLYDTTFVLSPGNFPKIDGSTTNVPLARIICCKMFNSTYTWRENRSALSNSYWETVPDSSNSDLYNKIMGLTLFSKTPQSYDSLITGKRELILVASAPSARHYEAAAAAGLTFDIRPFAVDALLMVVNKNYQVAGITTQNIKDIYTKTVTNWNEIGGDSSLILAYKREETSGSQELMKTLIMKDMPINSSIPLLTGMLSVFDELEYDWRAISYTPYYYKEFQMRDTLIRSLSIDGIKPERNSLYKRTYPHCADVYVVSLTNLSDTTQAAKLRDWLLAPQGQRVVVESGYVPIRDPDPEVSPESKDPFTITWAPDEKVENGYVFEKGSIQLNNYKYMIVPDSAIIVSEASDSAVKIYSRKEIMFGGHPPRAISIKTGNKYMSYCTRSNSDSLFLATFGEWEYDFEGGTSIKCVLHIPKNIQIIKRSELSGVNSIGNYVRTDTFIQPPEDCYWYGSYEPAPGWNKVDLVLDSLRTMEN